MKPPIIHYAGALRWRTSSGSNVEVLGGWAACCSGDRASKIRERGNHTHERSLVTCKLCRAALRRHDATTKLLAAEEAKRLRWN